MKLNGQIVALAGLLAIITFSAQGIAEEKRENDDLPETSMYLGQAPPGDSPIKFAPGIVSSEQHTEMGCCFSPDGKEFYFTRTISWANSSTSIYVTRFENEKWSQPVPAHFSSDLIEFEPFISLDGSRFFFGRSGHEDRSLNGIWMMEKTDLGWSKPEFFRKGMYVTGNLNGDLYLSDISKMPNSDIVKIPFVKGSYKEQILLRGNINSSDFDSHSLISPDERFLIFVTRNRKGGPEYNDLFVCFKVSDKWDGPYHLGALLGSEYKMAPMLTTDQKYLLYSSGGDIYWVSSLIIDAARKPELKLP